MMPSGRLRVRRAQSDDAPTIAAVLRAAFAEYEASYTPGGYDATTPSSDAVQSRISEGPTWVAYVAGIDGVDGAVAGTVSAVPKDDALYVRGMAVLPAARGYGAGDLLLRAVEAFAVAGGYRRLVLSTTPFLARAIRLYERWGFRRSDAGPHDLFGTPLFTMEKSLAGSCEAATDAATVPGAGPQHDNLDRTERQ